MPMRIEDVADVPWDRTVDVVVVGSGAAGFAAALTAASEGAKVALLEAGDLPGGTTAKSGGTTWVPNNRWMKARGVDDNVHQAIRYLARLAYPVEYNPDATGLGLHPEDYSLIEAFCLHASEAVDHLAELGALEFVDRRAPNGEVLPPYPDYHANIPENGGVRGRSLSPGVPKDAELPRDFNLEGSLLPGGMIMIEIMRQKALEMGIDLLLGHRVADVIVDAEGQVRGVVVHVQRRVVLVRALRGVVFGSGGFLLNSDVAGEFLPAPLMGACAAETNDGDLIGIASLLGARLANMSQAWWTQMVLQSTVRARSTQEAVWYPFGDSMVQVNRFGHRVANEKQVYNERTQVHFHWDPQRLEYTNMLLFQIYDDVVANNPLVWPYRGQTPMPDEDPGYVISGSTLEELAAEVDKVLAQLSEDVGEVRLGDGFAEQLGRTIERFNGFARTGSDSDFHRGEEPIQVLAHGPPRDGLKNPTMAPFSEKGPYHCMIMVAGAIDSKGGPRIDAEGRILGDDGPIPHLYGAGNCVGSPFGQAYPGAGGSIASALTFGFLAGRAAARSQA